MPSSSTKWFCVSSLFDCVMFGNQRSTTWNRVKERSSTQKEYTISCCSPGRAIKARLASSNYRKVAGSSMAGEAVEGHELQHNIERGKESLPILIFLLRRHTPLKPITPCASEAWCTTPHADDPTSSHRAAASLPCAAQVVCAVF